MTPTDPYVDQVGPTGATTAPEARLRLDRLRWRVRRTLLRRRRSLAALLACVTVGASLSATRSPDAVSVPVVVAAGDLPSGATLTAGDLVTVDFRPGSEPTSAFSDPAQAAGRLLAAPVSRGEPITDARLVGPGLAVAHPGRTALPVRLPDPGMVALLEVGDLVDLVATDPEDGQVTTVATDVPVLALPDDDPGGSATTSGLPGSLLVVGVTAAEVAPVARATLASFVTYTWSNR